MQKEEKMGWFSKLLCPFSHEDEKSTEILHVIVITAIFFKGQGLWIPDFTTPPRKK